MTTTRITPIKQTNQPRLASAPRCEVGNTNERACPAKLRFQTERSGGFTLLFASLVISLLLVIALAIANTSILQFLLAGTGRDSQIAFYNADSAIECALYYDHGKVNGFSFPTNQTELGSATPITCNGQSSNIISSNYSAPTSTITYTFNPSSSCVNSMPSYTIEVNKAQVAPETFKTVIRSRGYNTCNANNPRRVERGLRIIY